MGNALRELRIQREIPVADMVAVVKQFYPKYDKVMQSKCEHGEDYGIELPADAMAALYATFDPERRTAANARKRDTHRLTCCIKARLETPVYEALQQLIGAAGYTTTQDWLTDLVLAYIERNATDE